MLVGRKALYPIRIDNFENLKDFSYDESAFDMGMVKEIRKLRLFNMEDWRDYNEYEKKIDELVQAHRK
jgi:hypothetical protein